MKRKEVLGTVDPASYDEFMSAVQAASDLLKQLGTQELSGLKQTDEPRWQAYKFMNGLGFHYGSALAAAYTEHIHTSSKDFPRLLEEVLGHLSMAYEDIEQLRDSRNDTVIRQAMEELPHLVPEWLDPDAVIAEALASYDGRGVYFNDFYYSVLQAISDFRQAFRKFLMHDKRSERMVFRKEGSGGEFIPAALIELNEEEERNLLKSVIEEANRKIAARTSYGVRQERLPAAGDFTILHWSNGASAWRVDQLTHSAMLARDNARTTIPLDANLIVVPFHSTLVEKVASGFDDSPLYGYSTEAKGRGEYPEPTDRNLRTAIRSILEQTEPDLSREDLALMAIKHFTAFQKAREGNVIAQTYVSLLLESTPIWQPYFRLVKEWTESR